MEAVDLRNLNIDFIDDGEVEHSNDGYKEHYYTILASINGEKIGQMIFSRVEGLPGEIFNQKFNDQSLNFIYIEKLSVNLPYQNFGIGTALYKKFGEIYQQNFPGEIVGRVFSNPVAEYAYRKAISMGYIPADAFNEEYTFRNTNDRRKELWTDLRNKLPDEQKGPDVWAKKF